MLVIALRAVHTGPVSAPALQRRPWQLALATLVLGVFYSAAPVRVQTDSIWTIPTALSLVRDGDADLSEFGAATTQTPHGLDTFSTGTYSSFPIGPSLLATPLLFVIDHTASALSSLPAPLRAPFVRWSNRSRPGPDFKLSFFDTTEVILASLFVALGVLAFFLFCEELAGTSAALIVTAVLALGSPALSTWTRALWSHGPAFACIAWAALLTLRGASVRSALAVGVLTAFAVLCRPTAALPAFAIGVSLLWLARRSLPRCLAATTGALVVLGLWSWWSYRTSGSALPSYYAPARLELTWREWANALLGQLASPSRGLFVYVPVLLVAAATPWMPTRRPVHLAAAALAIAHLLFTSRFPHWWGGHCYGPRLSSDAVPLLLVATLPVITAWRASTFGRALLAVLVVACLAVNLPGAFRWQTWDWSGQPVDVDTAPERLWSWSDPQFLR